MKAKEIVDLTTEEIQEKVAFEVENYNKLRLNHSISELENPMQLRELRKTIARLKTELRKRELAEQNTAK